MTRDPRLTDIEGFILAGGQSRRMGVDKASLELDGSTLLERLVRLLTGLFDIVRIGAGHDHGYAAFGVPIQPDLEPGLGPLGAIYTALSTAACPVVCVVACDLPYLTTDFLRGLADRLEDNDAVVPRLQRVPAPTCALYHVRCREKIAHRIAQRELRATSFLSDVKVRWLDDAEIHRLDPAGRALINVNTPADYRRALRLNRKRSSSPP